MVWGWKSKVAVGPSPTRPSPQSFSPKPNTQHIKSAFVYDNDTTHQKRAPSTHSLQRQSLEATERVYLDDDGASADEAADARLERTQEEQTHPRGGFGLKKIVDEKGKVSFVPQDYEPYVPTRARARLASAAPSAAPAREQFVAPVGGTMEYVEQMMNPAARTSHLSSSNSFVRSDAHAYGAPSQPSAYPPQAIYAHAQSQPQFIHSQPPEQRHQIDADDAPHPTQLWPASTSSVPRSTAHAHRAHATRSAQLGHAPPPLAAQAYANAHSPIAYVDYRTSETLQEFQDASFRSPSRSSISAGRAQVLRNFDRNRRRFTQQQLTDEDAWETADEDGRASNLIFDEDEEMIDPGTVVPFSGSASISPNSVDRAAPRAFWAKPQTTVTQTQTQPRPVAQRRYAAKVKQSVAAQAAPAFDPANFDDDVAEAALEEAQQATQPLFLGSSHSTDDQQPNEAVQVVNTAAETSGDGNEARNGETSNDAFEAEVFEAVADLVVVQAEASESEWDGCVASNQELENELTSQDQQPTVASSAPAAVPIAQRFDASRPTLDLQRKLDAMEDMPTSLSQAVRTMRYGSSPRSSPQPTAERQPQRPSTSKRRGTLVKGSERRQPTPGPSTRVMAVIDIESDMDDYSFTRPSQPSHWAQAGVHKSNKGEASSKGKGKEADNSWMFDSDGEDDVDIEPTTLRVPKKKQSTATRTARSVRDYIDDMAEEDDDEDDDDLDGFIDDDELDDDGETIPSSSPKRRKRSREHTHQRQQLELYKMERKEKKRRKKDKKKDKSKRKAERSAAPVASTSAAVGRRRTPTQAAADRHSHKRKSKHDSRPASRTSNKRKHH